MKIDCYISLNCTSEKQLKENVNKAIQLEAVEAEVSFHRIDDTEAERKGLKGSPSVFINGVDIMPGELSGFS
jgi:hypothetical protein